MKNRFIKSAVIVCSALAATTGLAHADGAPTSLVKFEREQLQSTQGQAEVRAQITQAADDVCALPSSRQLHMRRLQQACVDDAIADGERQLEQKIGEAAQER